MTSLLVSNIQKLLTENSFSVKEFERRAGLKKCSVQNILQGKSNKPSAETVLSIAKELGCSVEELFTSTNIKSTNMNSNEKHIKIYPTCFFNKTLLNEILAFIDIFLSKHNSNHYFWEILSGISEIYQYSYEKNNEILDVRFAEWWINRNISLL